MTNASVAEGGPSDTIAAPPPADDAPADAPPGDGAPPLVRALEKVLAKIEAAAVDPDPVEMVHDARKAMKEYRGLLRLIDGEEARSARREAAEASRDLATARDRATALEALDLLAEAGLLRAADHAAASAVIGEEAVDAQEAEHLRTALGTFLAAARARLAGGLDAQAAACDLVAGLRRGYRAARRGTFDTPPAMHEVRKRVVTHRYQMGFVAAFWGGRGARRAGRAQRLRDMLGAHQDIETLRPMLHAAADCLDLDSRARLDLAMQRLQRRLKKKAKALHAVLFRRGSKAFAARYRDLSPAAPP